jgi:opacity protein-like surface antigen
MKKLLLCVVMMLLFAYPALAEGETDKVKENVVSTENNIQTEENTFKHFKNGMNSCLLSLVYSTIKVNIAVIGGVVGGVAYPLSGFNAGVSKKIWSSSMGGTYLITEDILTGKEEPELFFKRKRKETTGE